MPPEDNNLLMRLLATFKVEALEHIQAIASNLVELEKASTAETQAGILETIFRSAHSLKGAARTVNETDIAALCQPLESIFAALKRSDITPTPQLFDLLHQVVDVLGKLLRFLDPNPPVGPKPPITGLILSLQSALNPQASPKPRAVAEKPAEVHSSSTVEVVTRDMADTVRVATDKLDAVLLQSEELLFAKLASAQYATRLLQLQTHTSEWKKRWAKLRTDVRALRHSLDGKKNGNGGLPASPQLARLSEFLDWNQNFFESLETELMDLGATASHDQRSIGAMVDNLLDEMKKVVVQPFSTLLDVFPRFIRELSREQGKEVDLVLRGGEIEIDRRILERMKDPLIHLVRNCLDHGIETPAIRTQKGKPQRATVTIGISQKDGGNVEMLVSDDGAGIVVEKVKTAALKAGLLTPEKADALGEHDALLLACQTGVSTSPIITDISGRGLGLAIVKEKTEKLNGSLAIETAPGQGTTFRITLPLTLARFRGIVVRVEEHLFVLPTSNVERVARVAKEEVKTVGNRETIAFNGEAVSLVRLGDVLTLSRKTPADEHPGFQPAIVLVSAGQRIAFAVDEILYEQEVLVKTLPKQLGAVRNIAGATILGTGRVVPILSISDLMKSAVEASESGVGSPVVSARASDAKKKSLLVAEDSITSRTLLKNILESAGYDVQTAVDGIDAFTSLRSSHFDLVVSDVDMPRMNGFGLTAKIRADKKLAALPVVLVTALDSREDREHGIDVGASAYIVKSSFDQSNLLEVIRRLI
ncbi:MAG: hybrid sensor histidine kinase/response regulator [Chthoniobacteraceae bacterium]